MATTLKFVQIWNYW